MSERDINRWGETVNPSHLKPTNWEMGAGGSWDMAKIQPIPDAMLAELMQRYHYAGAPWNCQSMPLAPSDREYMYLLYYSMQGLVARVRKAEKSLAAWQDQATRNEQARWEEEQRTKAARLALENCLALAGRHRKEDWAQHVIRFCEAGGVVASPLRTA